MPDNRDTRIKKIQETAKKATILTNHPHVAQALGLTSNPTLEGRSEADLIEIERRLGGRVS